MIGRIKQVKPTAPADLCIDLINDAIRFIQQDRPYWSDTIKKAIISVPDPYAVGTVSTTTGSNLLNGTGTAWPVADRISGTIPFGVTDTGYQEVAPDTTSMAKIDGDTYLLVDAGSLSQETVAVIRTTDTTFWAKFKNTHPVNTTITSSSFAGRQFRAGSNYPIFTIRSIISATQAELDLPWGGPPLTGIQYQIVKMYFTLSLDFKDFLDVVDQQQGIPLDFHLPLQAVNDSDPQRTDTGDPLGLVDLGPNENGNMQYELWPSGTSARQLYLIFYEGWPEMEKFEDVPPWFIDPMMIVNKAIAIALRTKIGPKDPFYLPKDAEYYDVLYAKAMAAAVNADESKRVWAIQNRDILGRGANYWIRHDPDVQEWAL